MNKAKKAVAASTHEVEMKSQSCVEDNQSFIGQSVYKETWSRLNCLNNLGLKRKYYRLTLCKPRGFSNTELFFFKYVNDASCAQDIGVCNQKRTHFVLKTWYTEKIKLQMGVPYQKYISSFLFFIMPLNYFLD